MLLDANLSVVVMIDLQQRLLPAIDKGVAVLAQCVKLARIAQLLSVPVLATEQMPDKLGGSDAGLIALCSHTLAKQHFDACADGLIEAIDATAAGRNNIVIGGCEAHVCVLQTALSLLQSGYKVSVVSSAVGSRHNDDRDTALDRLRQAGAHIVTLEMVAFEWMRLGTHPQFRDVLKLIK